MARLASSVRLLVALGAGCGPQAEDTSAGTLPPEETASGDSGDTTADTFTFDTSLGDTATDVSPEHTLTMTHEGAWSMSPNGGPWTAMTGTLVVTEVLDGDVASPLCAVTFALTGLQSEESCGGCVAAFDILYYVAEGDRSACRDPELPQDGETTRMGWSDRDAAALLDYDRSGVWVSWYPGEREDDAVTLSWSQNAGVALEDTGN